MQIEELQQWIKENLFDTRGRINGRRISNNGEGVKNHYPSEYNHIFNLTSFLDDHSPQIRQRLYHIYNDMLELSKCEVCGNVTTFGDFNMGYKRFCSLTCRNIGTEEQRKLTNIKKFGVEYPTQNKDIINRIKQTNIEKYGVEHYFQSEECKNIIKEKRQNETPEQKELRDSRHRESCIKNNGEGNQTNNVKRKQTNLERFDVDSYSKTDSFKKSFRESQQKRFFKYILPPIVEKIQNREYEILNCEVDNIRDRIKIKCDKGHVFYRIVNNLTYNVECPLCNNNKSKAETEIYNFLDENNIQEIVYNTKSIISPLELDIYLPYHNIAIEFNGLYWHSEENGKGKYYHLNKTELCEEKGIQLLHIFENEWNEKQEIVKSIILSKLNIYSQTYNAEQCHVKEIDRNTKNNFLNNNELQGSDSSSVKLGLFNDNDLLSVMTFSKKRIDNRVQYKMLRYCDKLNTYTSNGMLKLFDYFINIYSYDEIIAYADRRYGNSSFYKKLGFELDYISGPNYKYIFTNKIQGRKDHLDFYDDNLTEYENMMQNGYSRIWDCGSLVYKYLYKYK